MEFGVSGRMRDPTVMMRAGTTAPPRLSRQPQPPGILEKKKFRTLATRMPMVIESWNPMFSAPLYLYGAISERYNGTDCQFEKKKSIEVIL